jgi:hypothetical protein
MIFFFLFFSRIAAGPTAVGHKGDLIEKGNWSCPFPAFLINRIGAVDQGQLQVRLLPSAMILVMMI